jgi:hypothetical protein
MIYHANEGCEVKPQVAEVFTALHSSREFQLNRIEEIEKKMLNEPQVEVPLIPFWLVKLNFPNVT